MHKRPALSILLHINIFVTSKERVNHKLYKSIAIIPYFSDEEKVI